MGQGNDYNKTSKVPLLNRLSLLEIHSAVDACCHSLIDNWHICLGNKNKHFLHKNPPQYVLQEKVGKVLCSI